MRETAGGSFIEFIGYRMPQHEQNWPSSVNDDRSRFPGKSNSLQKRFLFLISIAQWNIEEKDTTMSIVADGKGQNRGKNRKSCKMWWEPDNQSTDSFSNYDSQQLLADTCITKRKSVFNMMYGKVWFDGDFFVRNLRRRGAPPALVAFSKGFFFSFLDRVVPFFLLWANFFTNDYLPLLIFPWAKIFP